MAFEELHRETGLSSVDNWSQTLVQLDDALSLSVAFRLDTTQGVRFRLAKANEFVGAQITPPISLLPPTATVAYLYGVNVCPRAYEYDGEWTVLINSIGYNATAGQFTSWHVTTLRFTAGDGGVQYVGQGPWLSLGTSVNNNSDRRLVPFGPNRVAVAGWAVSDPAFAMLERADGVWSVIGPDQTVPVTHAQISHPDRPSSGYDTPYYSPRGAAWAGGNTLVTTGRAQYNSDEAVSLDRGWQYWNYSEYWATQPASTWRNAQAVSAQRTGDSGLNHMHLRLLTAEGQLLVPAGTEVYFECYVKIVQSDGTGPHTATLSMKDVSDGNPSVEMQGTTTISRDVWTKLSGTTTTTPNQPGVFLEASAGVNLPQGWTMAVADWTLRKVGTFVYGLTPVISYQFTSGVWTYADTWWGSVTDSIHPVDAITYGALGAERAMMLGRDQNTTPVPSDDDYMGLYHDTSTGLFGYSGQVGIVPAGTWYHGGTDYSSIYFNLAATAGPGQRSVIHLEPPGWNKNVSTPTGPAWPNVYMQGELHHWGADGGVVFRGDYSRVTQTFTSFFLVHGLGLDFVQGDVRERLLTWSSPLGDGDYFQFDVTGPYINFYMASGDYSVEDARNVTATYHGATDVDGSPDLSNFKYIDVSYIWLGGDALVLHDAVADAAGMLTVTKAVTGPEFGLATSRNDTPASVDADGNLHLVMVGLDPYNYYRTPDRDIYIASLWYLRVASGGQLGEVIEALPYQTYRTPDADGLAITADGLVVLVEDLTPALVSFYVWLGIAQAVIAYVVQRRRVSFDF